MYGYIKVDEHKLKINLSQAAMVEVKASVIEWKTVKNEPKKMGRCCDLESKTHESVTVWVHSQYYVTYIDSHDCDNLVGLAVGRQLGDSGSISSH